MTSIDAPKAVPSKTFPSLRTRGIQIWPHPLAPAVIDLTMLPFRSPSKRVVSEGTRNVCPLKMPGLAGAGRPKRTYPWPGYVTDAIGLSVGSRILIVPPVTVSIVLPFLIRYGDVVFAYVLTTWLILPVARS